jgi:hypothetical protein
MGTYTLDDALVRVYRTLRDTAGTLDKQLLGDVEIEGYIGQATTRYSLDRPREMVEDKSADGTYFLALPTAFEEGFSVLRAIETPPGEEPPVYLDERYVSLYRSPVVGPPVSSVLLIHFDAAFLPPASQVVRLSYTARRSFGVTAAATTVLDRDLEAVCDLTVSICCDAISQKYARTHEPILSADAVAPRDKADVWASRAKRYEARYREAMGPAISTGTLNWDSRASWSLGSWLTHSRLRR